MFIDHKVSFIPIYQTSFNALPVYLYVYMHIYIVVTSSGLRLVKKEKVTSVC